MVAPFGREFPGLAIVKRAPNDDVVDLVARAVSAEPRRLGLVRVERPADVVAAVGWEGALNYTDARSLSTVLRSWEDRFGAVVVGLGFDVMTLAVRRPPATDDEALRVAAELYAFCPDQVQQGTDSIAAYAKLLKDQVRWDFWWD